MTKQLSNIRIYGDESSAVFCGPKGSTLPTGLAAPAAALREVGWISEDGNEITREFDANEFYAWQGGKLARVKRDKTKDKFKFQCLEETADALGLYYAGSTGTTTTGISTLDVKSGSVSDERTWVLDFYDGDVTKRYNIPRGEVVGLGSLVHKSSEMTVYEFEVMHYGDFKIVTNNPAVSFS